VKHGAKLSDDGRTITQAMVRDIVNEKKKVLKGARMEEASAIFDRMMTDQEFAEFLTLVAYEYID
jgi:deoxyhypusine synthase